MSLDYGDLFKDIIGTDIQIGASIKNLEKYEIVRFIGRGKYSTVFEGRNVENKEKVAIKIYKPLRSKKFLRETLIISLFNHPNIIKVFDSINNPV